MLPTARQVSSGCRRHEETLASAHFRHASVTHGRAFPRYAHSGEEVVGTGLEAAFVIDTLRLTAEDAAGLIERGEASAAELHRAYLDAIADRDGELHAYLTTVEEPDGDGVPIALKDVISTKAISRAVWWLMTSSNLSDRTTGRSETLSPLRMRPV